MRIESGLSSASVDDRMDSPQSSPSLSPSLVNARGSKSTNDNILIARRPLLRRDEGGSLRRSVRTTPVEEQSSSRAPVPQHVDEDVIDLEDDDEHDADNAPAEEISAFSCVGTASVGRSGRRGGSPFSSLRPSSHVSSRRTARSPSVQTGGLRRDIPSYADVMREEMPISLVAPRGGEPVTAEGKSSGVPPAGGFMADAIRSSALGGRESGSLKRPSEGIMVGDIHEEKRSRRDPYARVFRYDRDTPFVNEERACAEYFCLPRNAFTNIPDADDLVHAKEFKDMARFDAHSKAHAVRLVYLYEKDLKRMRTKLEDMFAEKELRDNRIKELEVTVDAEYSWCEDSLP
ncbi:hypothetical protein Bca101_050542 [Brassica carinata]